jgi:7-keto-8-aminopelargonate synthetase-like enzyme
MTETRFTEADKALLTEYVRRVKSSQIFDSSVSTCMAAAIEAALGEIERQAKQIDLEKEVHRLRNVVFDLRNDSHARHYLIADYEALMAMAESEDEKYFIAIERRMALEAFDAETERLCGGNL